MKLQQKKAINHIRRTAAGRLSRRSYICPSLFPIRNGSSKKLHSQFSAYSPELAISAMPFESKNTVRVLGIPAGTTQEQYKEFEKHLCTLLVDESRMKSLFSLSRMKRRLKSSSNLPVPPPGPEPSTQDIKNASQTEQVWRRTTFARQRGQTIGTISFKDTKTKDKALSRYPHAADSKWINWTLTDTFKRLTVLYEFPKIEEIDVE